MIVMDDADLDKAIAGAIGGMRFTRQGQSCTASSRILVHESLHEEFVNRLLEKVNTLKMGDPLDEETDIGTIINRKQRDKVCGYIEIGEEEGATKNELSALPTDTALADGMFVRPVVFTNVKPDARLPAKKFLALLPVCSGSKPLTRRLSLPMTATLAWPQPSGPRTLKPR